MAKKKWQVIKNTTAEHVTGVDIGDEKMAFRRNGTFIVDDPQLARDIDKIYGRKGNQQVAVVPYNDHETRELGHNYTFAGVDTSHFKVWVLKRGKVVRVTKAQAHAKGYKVVAAPVPEAKASALGVGKTRKRLRLTEVTNG